MPPEQLIPDDNIAFEVEWQHQGNWTEQTGTVVQVSQGHATIELDNGGYLNTSEIPIRNVRLL